MALDEPSDQDETFTVEDFTVVMDKDLFSQTGNITVDMTYYGFTVESEKPVGGGAGGCSGGSCSTDGAGGGCSSSGCSC